MDTDEIIWKVITAGAAMLAGSLAVKVVDQVWEKAGHDRLDPKDPNAPLIKALTYAAVTGIVVGTARTFASRKAAEYSARTSFLPDPPDRDTDV